MINLHLSKSNCCYSIVVVAILVQIINLNLNRNDTGNPDLQSAVKRAKTETCRRELAEFAKSINDLKFTLRRSCKLDSTEQKIVRVCCASNNTEELIQLDDQVSNTHDCLDLCFSYGHSHGGYQSSSGTCYCGDNQNHNSCDSQKACENLEEFDYYKVNHGVYSSKRQPIVIDNSISIGHRQVKIAFLLTLSGSNALQVHRLLKNIYSESHFYYLHIDKRSDNLFHELLHLEDSYTNVFLSRSRLATVWGSPNLLKVILNSFRELSTRDWDYIMNLSESDFPIKPLKLLENYLGFDPGAIYLKEHNIKGYRFIKKQGLDRNFYQCEDRVWRVGRRTLPTGIVYSGGSDWFALPRNFCDYIVDNLGQTDSLVKTLVDIYNHTLLPAESFFHTLASNSEYCDKLADGNLRITNWNRKQGCKCQHRDVVDWCGCSPLVYRSSDWEKVKKTNTSANLFFSRKFDPTISASIIGAVEEQLLQGSVASSGEYDTRYWQRVLYNGQLVSQSTSGSRTSPLVFVQFGLYCLRQIASVLNSANVSNPDLSEVDFYFNRDRFDGLVFRYCDADRCFNFLVRKNNNVHLTFHNKKCSEFDTRKLQVIEVNHSFDAGERIFRDHKPLNHFSDIAVYHEWYLYNVSQQVDGSDRLQFSWISPSGELELIQQVKFKNVSKPTRLSLAHRLNIAGPLTSGEWILKISRRNIDCLKYKYLVFDDTCFRDSKIAQAQFDRYYTVTKLCYEGSVEGNEYSLTSCTSEEWSTISKRNKNNLN